MTSRRRDQAAGLVLLIAALVWVALVVITIPSAASIATDARAFPLWLGLLLAALCLLLFLQSFIGGDKVSDDESRAPVTREEVWSVGMTVALTVVYAAFMERLGFLPASALFVAAVMIVLLRIRRPLFILTLSVALPLGSYILFGKLLGTYLPPGTWITLYF